MVWYNRMYFVAKKKKTAIILSMRRELKAKREVAEEDYDISLNYARDVTKLTVEVKLELTISRHEEI